MKFYRVAVFDEALFNEKQKQIRTLSDFEETLTYLVEKNFKEI